MLKEIVLGTLVILAALHFAACDKDDPDDGPIYVPKALYEVVGDLNELDEIPCLDEVPSYDPAQVGHYDFAFEDSVLIEHIAMNPNNRNQWVFGKRYVLNQGFFGSGTEAVYWTDLSTGEYRFIDSSENLKSLVYGGDYVVMEQDQGCAFYQVSTGGLSQIEGIQPSISPNGKWLKLYMYKDFSNQREDLFQLPELTVRKSWERIGGVSPGTVLWFSNDEFIFFRSMAHSKANEIRRYSVGSDDEVIDYSSLTSSFGGPPEVWLTDDIVLTSGGVQVDFNKQSEDWIYRRCENKYFDQFISIGRDREFIGKKIYYRADHDAKVVYYSHQFHLLKPDEGLEQRLKLVFDN